MILILKPRNSTAGQAIKIGEQQRQPKCRPSYQTDGCMETLKRLLGRSDSCVSGHKSKGYFRRLAWGGQRIQHFKLQLELVLFFTGFHPKHSC